MRVASVQCEFRNYPAPPLKSAQYHIYLVLLTALTILCSCGKQRKTTEGLEGRIVYDLTFPYEKNSVMLDLYPKEMTVYFKGDKLHTEIRSSYDLLTTDFIIDNEKRSFCQMLKNVSKRYSMQLNEEETIAWYKKSPEYAFEPLEGTEVICGYVCNKTLARALNTDLPPVTIYHTRGLGLGNDNWWNPYHGIDGFLLAYDVLQYGMIMRMKAREVIFESVDDKHFIVPENYLKVDANAMDAHLQAVVSEYIQ
jgi:hypothetical protein